MATPPQVTTPPPAGEPTRAPGDPPPGTGKARDRSPIVDDEALAASCQAGDAEACFQAGRSAAEGDERRGYLKRGCDLDHGESCVGLAVAQLRAGTLDGVAALLSRGCRLAAAIGCTLLGEAHWHGPEGMLGLPRSRHEARALHQRAWELRRAACERGDGAACDIVGSALENGHTGHNAGSGITIPKDPAKGRELRIRACEHLDHAPACRSLAVDLHGKDDDRARKYRQRACELGDDELCR